MGYGKGRPKAVAAGAWKYSKSASSIDGKKKKKRNLPTWDKWQLSEAARALTPAAPVARCARYVIKKEGLNLEPVRIMRSEKGRCSFCNLQMCGSVWTCPVCALRISARRGEELAKGIEEWRAQGGDVLHVTYTLHHSNKDSCHKVKSSLLIARRSMRSGRNAVKIDGLVGTVRSIETTVGAKNGWHVHCHELLFIDSKCSAENIYYVKSVLHAAWSRALKTVGASCSFDRGVDVSLVRGDALSYVSKTVWGGHSEVSSSVAKSAKGNNMAVWQLLADVLETGDIGGQSARWWQEYVSAFKGTRQLCYSKGLRGLLGLGKDKSPSDEEVANDQGEALELVAEVCPVTEWPLIVANSLRGELLIVAEKGGSDAVQEFLADLLWQAQSEQAEHRVSVSKEASRRRAIARAWRQRERLSLFGCAEGRSSLYATS